MPSPIGPALPCLDVHSMALVTLRNVTFHDIDAQRPALDSVSLDVNPKQWLSIVGASKSGKTTIVLSLAGILGDVRPGLLTGAIEYASEMASLPRPMRVGVVL